MKNISHKLYQKETAKILNLTLVDNQMISESGKLDKLRKTQKEFATSEEAFKGFIKKEWQALKKGFNLYNEKAKKGEPILHTYIGGGYTGCLSFQNTPKGTYIYKNIDDIDYLILIDDVGITLEEIQLPKQLAWNIEYRDKTNSLILNLDHFIYEYEIEKNIFNNIGDEKSNWESFLSVTQNRTGYATNGKIFTRDNENNVLLNRNYEKLSMDNDSSFCGKLSNDGKLLAFHNTAGEIQIIDTTTGNVLNKITADFENIKQIEFAENNKLLVTREHYGSWGMRYFDLSNNNEIKIEGLAIPAYSYILMDFCFNKDQSKLVIIDRTSVVYIYDFENKKFLYSFKIQHSVQRSEIKFIGENLAVRTDYGCFSIYTI